MNFWQQLTKPIIGFAPMDGVSDAPFRFIVAKYGKPDVTITEFISVDGISHGAERLFTDFIYHDIERPVCAQVFGNDPDLFYLAAKVVCELGFDGLDINMGCPAKSVAARGAGAGLIKNPKLALKIIEAAKQGVSDWVSSGKGDLPSKVENALDNTKEILPDLGQKTKAERKTIPVSVKTRIGFDEIVIEDWVENLLEAAPANISVHGRTLKQLYSGAADWGAIGRGASIVKDYNQGNPEPVTIIGNGDVCSRADYLQKLEQSGVDGVLVGRATLGNPWIFAELRGEHHEVTLQEKIEVAIEHAAMHEKIKSLRAFVEMRKHFGWYLKNFPGASRYRSEIMQTNSTEQAKIIFAELLSKNNF